MKLSYFSSVEPWGLAKGFVTVHDWIVNNLSISQEKAAIGWNKSEIFY